MKKTMIFILAVFCASVMYAGGLDFLLTPDPRDDIQVISHVIHDFFKPDKDGMGKLVNAFPGRPDEYAPALFLAQKSGKSISGIIDLRKGGLSWNDIFVKIGVPLDAVFVDMPRDPGPPYGNAWGHWSRNGKQGKHGKHGKGSDIRLSDNEITSWLNLQVTSKYFGLDPSFVAEQRASGKTFSSIAGSNYREKHKSAERKSNDNGPGKDKGKSEVKGKDKEEQKGKGKKK